MTSSEPSPAVAPPLPSRVAIVGGGKAANALRRSLDAVGVVAAIVGSRGAVVHVGDADVVFVAVVDDAIADVAARVAAGDDDKAPLVVHLAGSMGVSVLPGTRRGAFHVLASLSAAAPLSAGALCALDADDDSDLGQLFALATALGLTPVHIREHQRAAYHASAVIAGNLATGLLQLAIDLAGSVGVDGDVARVGLARLLASTAERAIAAPLPQALTGPIARGDVDTVRRHVEAIDGGVTKDVYVLLSRVLSERVRPEMAARFHEVLTNASGAPEK
jgi:predicted short-subunit dehydrogenase-like oxidoreductase (DUF2520 family)